MGSKFFSLRVAPFEKESIYHESNCFPAVVVSSLKRLKFNPGPVEPGYALPLQTLKIQIRWLLQSDLDRYCSPLYVILYQQPGLSNLIG